MRSSPLYIAMDEDDVEGENQVSIMMRMSAGKETVV